MFLSPQEALGILEHYKYLLIFPITVIEGPIITVIGGFLVSLGYLNFFVAYFFLALGDWVGDALHYVLGRYYSKSVWFRRLGAIFGYDERREKIIEEHFRKHPGKTVLTAKVSHGVGGIIQIVAGMSKMDFWQFMKFSLIGTLPKTLVLLLLGYFLGHSYERINNYMDNIAYAVISVVVLIIFYLILRNYVKDKLIKK